MTTRLRNKLAFRPEAKVSTRRQNSGAGIVHPKVPVGVPRTFTFTFGQYNKVRNPKLSDWKSKES